MVVSPCHAASLWYGLLTPCPVCPIRPSPPLTSAACSALLEPTLGDEFDGHPGRAARHDELVHGRTLVTRTLQQAGNDCNLTATEIERLLLALTLNCHGVRDPPLPPSPPPHPRTRGTPILWIA